MTTYLGCSSNSDSSSCETPTCQNGGTVVNCECDCPLGYSGSNCATELTPSRVSIKKAIVKGFPNTNNGSDWDLAITDPEDALADIYITFQDSNLAVIYDSPTYYENVLANGNDFFEFTIMPNIELTNFNAPYLVNIWDYDPADEDDFMTSYGFFAYTANTDFPNIITVVSQTNNILVDLEVEYEW